MIEITTPRNIIVVTAPSGAGKSTLCKHGLQWTPDLEFSISHTCRNRRKGEVHGVDYWYVSLDEFLGMIKKNQFIEKEEVYSGKWYGTSYSEIERVIEKNKHHILLDLDVKGALSIKEKYPDAKVIYVAPPDFQTLETRLKNRNDTSADQIIKRLEKAPWEMKLAEEAVEKGLFEIIVNRDLEIAKKQFLEIINYFIGVSEVI